VQNGVLQGWDVKKLAMGNYLPGVPGGTAGDQGEIKGTRYFVPSVWGTEALTFDPKQVDGTYGKLGLADLFDDKWTAKVTLRGHSALAAMGRVLEAQGKLPLPFLESFKSEEAMRKIWDVCLAEAIKHKKNVVQFWKGEDEAQSAFKNNGAALGLTWDSTGYSLKKDGFGFVAPKEGAFAWSQGFVLLKGAKNAEQAHAFAKWVSSPEGSGAWASAFYANPVAKGGAGHMAADVPAFYATAFPAEAMKMLWWWPPFEGWYLKLRGEYADKYISA
jgi:spermidine/putrescine transport system substrate-binding protein